MPRRPSFVRIALPLLIAALLTPGCQRAGRYEGRPISPPESAKTTSAKELPPLDLGITWRDAGGDPLPDVRIEFVHAETDADEWAKLPKFWNALARPEQTAAMIGLLATGPLAAGQPAPVVKIKVPLGLDDPRSYVPAENPLTLGKWELGRKLFYDDSYLEEMKGTSCASCHQPDRAFADNVKAHSGGFNTPTLVNCVFNTYQLWDGRATRLEEVVQRTPEDERKSDKRQPFRHVWSGVIERLKKNDGYRTQFGRVFGHASATQDTVGRALACYLRTLLAGNSLHDRALVEKAKRNSRALEPAHYEAILDAAALKQLDREKKTKAEAAAELHHGYRLFYNLDTRKSAANCIHCHGGRNFTDGQFHNIGMGASAVASEQDPTQLPGRFAQVPIGQKSRYLIAAYKTPTLRTLLRTGPYFHDGSSTTLDDVIRVHSFQSDRRPGLFFDRELRDPADPTQPLSLNLSAAEVEALVLFLRALDGDGVDAAVAGPPQ